ncbi:hypothetical protein D918_00127 [Trichuris suis]|nr:hypothetical protein D918_00127 [Trichuris suis]
MQEVPFIETNTSLNITYDDLCSEVELLTSTWIALAVLSIVAVCVNLFLLFVMMKYRLWRSQFFVAAALPGGFAVE